LVCYCRRGDGEEKWKKLLYGMVILNQAWSSYRKIPGELVVGPQGLTGLVKSIISKLGQVGCRIRFFK